MFTSPSKKKLDALMAVIQGSNGGVFKRIDENRELLELLFDRAPQVLEQHPWVIGWLASQDVFLVSLAETAKVETLTPLRRAFPRPWPARAGR
jgi:hypothetical protein